VAVEPQWRWLREMEIEKGVLGVAVFGGEEGEAR
jgi:hypothetical protein